MEIPKPLFLLLFLLLPVLYFIIKHFKNSKSPPLPPGPYSWPILGNLLQVGKNPLAPLTKFGQIYGPIFSIKLGCQRVVVASSPDAAIEVLKTEDRIFAGRSVPQVHPAAQNPEHNSQYIGWATENNETWKDLRAVCKTQLFSSKAIDSQACVREEKGMKMVKYIASMEGKPVKIVSVTFAAVFDMLSQIFLSMDLINFEQEIEDGWLNTLFRDLVEMAVEPNLSDLYPILSPFDLQGKRKKIMKIHQRICYKWEAIIKERRKRKRGNVDYNISGQQDLLDALLSHGFPNGQIIVMLRELLLAGSDSSALTIEWIVTELLRTPRCMKIVQEELSREIGQNRVTELDLPKLSYLQACFKETLRLHPPAPFLVPRRALESCQVMNYTIPKDSKVLVNVWAIGRDPKYWEDPLVFKPERFLKSTLEFKGNNFEFLPFGSGRRMCPGMPMASKQVPLVLASLLHFFDWSLPCGLNPNDLSMRAKYGLTLVKEEPLFLIPKVKVSLQK